MYLLCHVGKTRSLSSDEIIVQYFYAQQLIYQNHPNQNHPHGKAIKRTIPPITNVGTYLKKIFCVGMMASFQCLGRTDITHPFVFVSIFQLVVFMGMGEVRWIIGWYLDCRLF